MQIPIQHQFHHITCHDVQHPNPALIPLIVDSHNSIISAWKSFRHCYNQHNITFPSFDLVTMSSFLSYAHSVMAIKTHTIKVYLSSILFFSKLLTGIFLEVLNVKSQLKTPTALLSRQTCCPSASTPSVLDTASLMCLKP